MKETPEQLAMIIKDASRRARLNAAKVAGAKIGGTMTMQRHHDTAIRQVERMEAALDKLVALANKK